MPSSDMYLRFFLEYFKYLWNMSDMQPKMKVSKDGRSLERDGNPFPYLADTCWSAFTHIAMDEWRDYLELRRQQGFTAIQINILPQWDRSYRNDSSEEPEPFEHGDTGYDFSRPVDGYFKRAERMLEVVVELDLLPALVVLWANYVPGNWCSKRNPGNTIPRRAIDPYVEFVLARFERFEPLLLVSGDTDFPTDESDAWYTDTLAACKRVAPNLLTTLHISGEMTDLPGSFVENTDLDIIMYQSGHYLDQDRLGPMARTFRALSSRPVIDGEICYEGMGKFGSPDRFTRRDTRAAMWISMLSGANAGVGYGASGVWNWHRPGAEFAWADTFGESLTVFQALALPGAWDVGLIGYLFNELGLHELEPDKPDKHDADKTAAGRFACARVDSKGVWIAYGREPMALPMPDDVRLRDVTVYDLSTGRLHRVNGRKEKNGAKLLIPPVDADWLAVARFEKTDS